MIPITCNAVGDILALATLVFDIARAVKESGGSASDYRAFVGELNSLHIVLASISRVAERTTDVDLRAEIVREVDRCVNDMQRALERVAKFSDLGRAGVPGDAMRVKVKRNWYKLEWRFGQRGKVQEVRAELAAATQRLTTYLVISNADRMETLCASLSTQFNTSMTDMCTSLLESFAASAFRNPTQRTTTGGPSDSTDHTKFAAVALLCLAVCTINETSRATHTALLLAAICILMRGMGQQECSVSATIGYSSDNSVTLHDAIGRQLVLPFELCETREIFHATVVNLFSTSPGRWFIDNRKYQITIRNTLFPALVDWFFRTIERGSELDMEVLVQRAAAALGYWNFDFECPWCFAIDTLSRDYSVGPGVSINCAACGKKFSDSYWVYTSLNREDTIGVSGVEDRGLYPGARSASRFGCSERSVKLPREVGSLSPSISGFESPLNRENCSVAHKQSWQMLTGHFTRVSVSNSSCSAMSLPMPYFPMGSGFLVSNDRCELHRAAENGHFELVVALLDGGEAVDTTTTSGHTALHLASYNGHVDVVKLLLECGATVDMIAHHDVTPLASAIASVQPAVVSTLLSHGAIVDASKHTQAVALYAAALVSNVGMVHLLLRLGADVNARLFDRNLMALSAAVMGGNSALVDALIQYGADVRACSAIQIADSWPRSVHMTSNPRSILSFAAYQGYEEIFKLLESASGGMMGDELQSERDVGTPALLFDAIAGGNCAIVEKILDAGADVNMRTREGQTPLSKALLQLFSSKGLEIVQLLLIRGANPNLDVPPQYSDGIEGSQKSWNVLHDAASSGQYAVVEVLLQHGADVNARSEFGDTPLSLAMKELERYSCGTSPGFDTGSSSDDEWRVRRVDNYMKTLKLLLASGAVL